MRLKRTTKTGKLRRAESGQKEDENKDQFDFPKRFIFNSDMAHLSESQRIEILMIYGYGNGKRTQSEVYTVFNGIYPNNPVSQGTLCQLIKKIRETGNVKDVKRTGRPKSATSEEKALNVLLIIEDTPQVSTREVADNLEISHVSVLRILRKEKMHPYKLQLIHELNEDDFERRMDFCEYTMERCNADENFLQILLFR
ncbi:hypothetical protein NQ318_000313 [Aromia moschata]|uniref:DUF4817 domain-containing protein n=1 Tax=Aromia moschata TaxID=1265417 RepID=A0AAV8X4L2_9CUCU|nr:hypothetical protein NQ318_000313 [Aromia moschata]